MRPDDGDGKLTAGEDPALADGRIRRFQADDWRAARIALLGELGTSIAHEINQALAAIELNAETSVRWLSRDAPDLAKVAQLTSRIAQSARYASEVVRRVRGLAGSCPPERSPVDLNGLVEEALLLVQHDLDRRSISLTRQYAAELPRVLGDRIQLQQVVVNLLVNGIQAIVQAGAVLGKIELATRMDGDGSASLSIHDTGPGVPSGYLGRVFDGFFTTKQDGMGIGLSLCRSIIAAHGGTIRVSNHPKGGAVFSFSLPAAAERKPRGQRGRDFARPRSHGPPAPGASPGHPHETGAHSSVR